MAGFSDSLILYTLSDFAAKVWEKRSTCQFIMGRESTTHLATLHNYGSLDPPSLKIYGE